MYPRRDTDADFSTDSDPSGSVARGLYCSRRSDPRGAYGAVAGGSLGGIAAYRLAFQHSDTFSTSGIFGAGYRNCMMPAECAQAMKSILDKAGVENKLYVDDGGHHYTYRVPNFEMYLKWLAQDW